MRALPSLRRSPLAAAVRDRISQKKGQRQQALDACASRQGGRAAFHLARQHGAFGRRLGREPGHGFARARRSPGAAESDGCQPKSRDAGADAPADGTSAGLPARGSDWTRGRAASGCVSVCMFLSVRLRGRRLRTRWLGALGLCSRHLRRRRLHGTRAGAATCPLSPRGDALRSARGVGGASSSTNMDSESDGMAGGIGDGVMPRQIRLPMPTCKAQASKAAIHDVARLPRAFPPSQPRPLTWPAASIGTICNTRLTSPIPRATGDDSPRAGEDL